MELSQTITKPRPKWVPKSLSTQYIFAFAIGVIVGFKLVPFPLLAGLHFFIVGACLYFCLRRDVDSFFKWVPYAIYLEVYMRSFVTWVPYLTVQYMFICAFGLLMMKGVRLKTNHFVGIFLLGMYCFLELANNLSPYNPANTRAILINSLALFMPVLWASYNNLQPVLINKLLNNIKIAATFLAGIVFVAHITGKIDYGLFSNSTASNGLAPVQLSAYLGTACILFFLSIMNPQEKKYQTMNIVVLSITTAIMVLTFSRGGLYFLAGVIGVFIFYNRHKMGNYVKLLALVPIGFILYTVLVNKTGGKIVERYEQEGTSSRDVLIAIGFTIFWENPIFGVGTGNYNGTIVKKKLFAEASGAHNEFVRAAAEHGIIGIAFYWTFYLLVFLDVIRRRQPQQQYAMYFFVLFVLIIVHNGLKISIQPILMMLVIGTPGLALSKTRNVYRKEHHERVLA